MVPCPSKRIYDVYHTQYTNRYHPNHLYAWHADFIHHGYQGDGTH